VAVYGLWHYQHRTDDDADGNALDRWASTSDDHGKHSLRRWPNVASMIGATLQI
jgi:hypothetical protein